MARFGELNTLAALVQARHTEARSLLSGLAALPPGEDKKAEERAALVLGAMTEDAEQYSSLAISSEQQEALRVAADQFEAVRRALGDASPGWVSDEQELLRLAPADARRKAGVETGKQLSDEQRRALRDALAGIRDAEGRRAMLSALHWRAAVSAAAAVALAVAVVTWVVAAEPVGERAEQAETVIAKLVSSENVVDCEPVTDHDSRFDCVAAIPVDSARGSGQAPHEHAGLLVDSAYADNGNDAWNSAIERVRRFLVVNGQGQKRQLITEMGMPSKPRNPLDLANADPSDLKPGKTLSAAE